jgi:hypothetical protein
MILTFGKQPSGSNVAWLPKTSISLMREVLFLEVIME